MLISNFDVPPIFKEFSRGLELYTQQPDFANSRIQLVFPRTGNNSGNTGNSGNIGYNNIVRNRIIVAPRATLIDENNNNKILTPNYNLLHANNRNGGNGGVAAAGARRVN